MLVVGYHLGLGMWYTWGWVVRFMERYHISYVRPYEDEIYELLLVIFMFEIFMSDPTYTQSKVTWYTQRYM